MADAGKWVKMWCNKNISKYQTLPTSGRIGIEQPTLLAPSRTIPLPLQLIESQLAGLIAIFSHLLFSHMDWALSTMTNRRYMQMHLNHSHSQRFSVRNNIEISAFSNAIFVQNFH